MTNVSETLIEKHSAIWQKRYDENIKSKSFTYGLGFIIGSLIVAGLKHISLKINKIFNAN